MRSAWRPCGAGVSGAASRRKGNVAELAVARVLRAAGWSAVTSRSAQGTQAGEDLFTDTPLSWEVKDRGKLDLSGWVDQARGNAGDRPAVVVVKRRGRGDPLRWYAVLELGDLLALLDRIRSAD
jgi:hypothetical protein